MSYGYDLISYLNIGTLGALSEIFLVTTCLATIIFLWSKNEYISYFAAAPIFYFISHIFVGSTHLIFLVLAMTIQALVNMAIQKQISRKEKAGNSQAPNM